MQDKFAGHRVTSQGLHIKGEGGTEIIVPFNELPRISRAIVGALGEPDDVQGPTERRHVRALNRIVKVT
jgi:hypothetical protein